MRQLLHTEWAKLNNLIYQQPLDAIKNYFGEHVGLYFSFLGQYIVFLCVMSVLGIAVFLYGVIYSSVGNSIYLEELAKDDRLLCPKCNRLCDYIPLSATYQSSQFQFWFDNFASFLYAIFVPVISIIFLEFWKRRQFELQYDWDLSNIASDHYPIRAEYEAAALQLGNRKIINVSTGEQEPYITQFRIIPRRVFSLIVVVTFMFLSALRAIGMVTYRTVVGQQFSASFDGVELIDGFSITSGMVTSMRKSLFDKKKFFE